MQEPPLNVPVNKTDTHQKQRVFLLALAKLGTVTHAAQAAGITRDTAYQWRHRSRTFQSEFANALEAYADHLERLLYQRAEDAEATQSVTALIFALKGARPDKYKDRATVEHAGRVEIADPDAAYERIAGRLARLVSERDGRGPDPATPAVNGSRNGHS